MIKLNFHYCQVCYKKQFRTARLSKISYSLKKRKTYLIFYIFLFSNYFVFTYFIIVIFLDENRFCIFQQKKMLISYTKSTRLLYLYKPKKQALHTKLKKHYDSVPNHQQYRFIQHYQSVAHTCFCVQAIGENAQMA